MQSPDKEGNQPTTPSSWPESVTDCAVSRPRAAGKFLAVGDTKMQHEILEWDGFCYVQRRGDFGDRRLAPRLIACRNRERTDPLPTAERLDNRRMHGMERQPEVRQPFRQFGGRARVVVIEVCSSREDFNGLESVTGDIGQMLACQPASVEEMRGDAEAVIRHRL